MLEASDHLWYEIWMFQSLVAGMGSGITGTSVINNAILESFAIHVRVLIHFFYADSRQDDDVIAEDFFADPTLWRNKRPPKTEVLATAKVRADKEVAHLTYSRQKVTPETKLWHFVPIAKDLQTAVQKFIELVPKELLGQPWDNTEEELGRLDQDGAA